MGDRAALCTLTGVEKGYGAFTLGPLSLTVYAGEILGLRGANGAGKSTLLALLAGALRPDRGERVLVPEAAGQIAIVPQELSLYDTLTVLDNLRFWGLAQGLPRRAVEARSRWLLEALGLSDRGRQPVSACSGGMKRRAHLATALMTTPRLLLLDEPTVGADQPSVERMLALLKHFARQGCGIVLISHQAGELARVSSRILTLEAGRPTPGEEGLWQV
ncbi:MAG: ABC transporter ATP-binding protein [Lawsonibacter sp.]|nr:ABC transporter ATP-binding protein [Lawsonibacter sp.]